MKNKLTDLNDHLFAQLERLSDENLSQEDIAREVARAQAVVSVADCIVANAGVQLKTMELVAEHGGRIAAPFLAVEYKDEPRRQLTPVPPVAPVRVK